MGGATVLVIRWLTKAKVGDLPAWVYATPFFGFAALFFGVAVSLRNAWWLIPAVSCLVAAYAAAIMFSHLMTINDARDRWLEAKRRRRPLLASMVIVAVALVVAGVMAVYAMDREGTPQVSGDAGNNLEAQIDGPRGGL